MLIGLTVAGCSSSTKSASTTKPAVTAVAGVTTVAATTESSGSGSSTGPAAADATITIKGFAFEIPASVAAGSTITIKNDDSANHTFSDKGGKFDVKMAGNSSQQFVVPGPGTYNVVCHIHSSMSGTLVVK